jgi:RNA polymerase subunit RPABC4/transcription elongation factor Spt4
MFEQLTGDLQDTISSIFESDAFQAAIYVIVAYIVLIWLSSAYWAYRDMRLRSASAITPYVAALAIILFTPVFFLFGLLLYRIVRPKETIAEVNERTIAEEAMLAEVASHASCANCSRPVHEEWIICPTCRNRLRRVCPNCEHLIELDWTLCAWCGKDFERAEAPGTTAFMPAARPAPPPLPQPVRRMPAPPPQPGARQSQPGGTPAARPELTSTAATSTPKGATTSSTESSSSSATPSPPTRPQSVQGPAPRSSGASSSSTTQPGTGAQPSTGF